MNADRLLALFEPISEAPDSIPRLRRFILDLAVRGKLVEQDPEDEAVAEVLRRMNIERSAKGDFLIPSAWEWVAAGDVSESRLGKMLDKVKNKGIERPYLRNLNVRWFDFDLSDLLEMRFENFEIPEYALKRGDVLICEGGEPGRAAVWDERMEGVYFQKAIHRARFCTFVDSVYFVYVLRASADDGRLSTYFTGTGISHFTGKELKSYRFPLPPLAEQHRIVAKVDELMALCDQLEAARMQREQCRKRLVAASLQRLNQPSDDPEAFRSDARFALQLLPSLTTAPAQIKQLRQTILNLAVRGKLVEQDPKDEPAVELISRIITAKRKKGRESGASLASTKDGNLLQELPKGWAWTSFEGYSLSVNTGPFGTTLPQSDYIEGGIPLVNPSHMKDQVIVCDPRVSVSEQTAARLSSYRLSDGDLVIARRGEVGRVALVGTGEDGWICGTGSFFASFVEEVPRDYLLLFMLSSFARGFLGSEGIGATMTNLNQKILKRLPIPLPPLAEQHRIVAKVDELMALCYQLEQQLSQAEQSCRALLEAVLQEALAGKLPEKSERSHAAL
jgi:type I restriction enzyme S subunit